MSKKAMLSFSGTAVAGLAMLSLLLGLTDDSAPVKRGPGVGPMVDPWRLTGNSGTDPTIHFVGTTDRQSLAIRTNNLERIRVTLGGWVGVGIKDPLARLHVTALAREHGLMIGHAGQASPDLIVDADGNAGINIADPNARFVIRNDFFGQRPLFSVLAGDQTPFHMSSAGSVTIDPVGAGVALRVKASNDTSGGATPVPFHVTAAHDENAIYVTRDGNVGIGVAGEGINDRLRIRGEENDGTSASLRIVSGANQQTMLLDGNEIDGLNSGLFLNNNSAEDVVLATGGGNVGIGDSTPANKLSVVDANHQIAVIDSDNGNKTWTLTSHQATDGIGFWENGSEGRFLVTAGGRVGIGTTDPNHELVVQGNDPAMQIRDDTTDNSANAARLELLERSGGNFDGGAFLWWNGESNKLLVGTKLDGANTNVLVIDRATSSVGIGTQTPGDYRLAVNGPVRAKEIVVETGWSDFVFEPDYNLLPLDQVEAHIKEHGHLPDIPSALEVAEHGVKVGEMESKLLQKIEELTLHMIEMNKRVAVLEEENARLRGDSVRTAMEGQR